MSFLPNSHHRICFFEADYSLNGAEVQSRRVLSTDACLKSALAISSDGDFDLSFLWQWMNEEDQKQWLEAEGRALVSRDSFELWFSLALSGSSQVKRIRMIATFDEVEASPIRLHGVIMDVTNSQTGMLENPLLDEQVSEISSNKVLESHLIQQEQFFENIYEKSAVGIAQVDLKGHFLQANQAYQQMVGYTEAELQNLTFQDLTHPEDIEMGKAYFRDLLMQNIPSFQLQKRYLTKSGEVVWGSLVVSLVLDVHGQADYCIAFIENITSNKQIEEQKTKTGERWIKALDGAGHGVWDWNLNTNQVYVSHSWRDMMELTDHRLEDYEEWESRIHPADLQKMLVERQKHLDGKAPIFKHEHRVKTYQDDYIWVLDQGMVWERNPDGTAARMVGTYTNITEWKKIQKEAELTHERLVMALEASEQGVWDWNILTGEVYYSRLWKKMLGYEEDEIGNSLDEWSGRLLPEESKHIHAKVNEHIYDPDSAGFKAEFRMVCKDGSHVWILAHGRAIERDKEGRAVRIMGTHTDISALKIAEKALKESEASHRQLFEANRAVQLIIEQATGHIQNANMAAEKFYGYTREQLKEFKISDINTLSKEEVEHEMALAKKEERNHFYFKHRLANGVIKDVEVHSGPVIYDGKECLYSIIHDVTDRLQVERALELERSRMAALFSSMPDLVWLKDQSGRYLSCNWRVEEFFGLPQSDIIGKDDYELTSSFNASVFQREDQEAMASKKPVINEVTVRFKSDNHEEVIETTKASVHGSDGALVGVLGIGRDITERRKNEASQKLAASVFTHAHDGIMICDAEQNIVDVNPTFSEISGYQREEILGKQPSILSSGRHSNHFYQKMWQSIDSKGYWSGEVWNRNKAGGFYAIQSNISVVKDENGVVTHYIAIFSDISLLKSHQETLERLAHYDALTQLPNRVLLADRLKQAMNEANRSNTALAVCFLDLDDFKPVNDSHGHAVGDLLLIEISKRLKRVVRSNDTIARLGGDEFVILFGNIVSDTELDAAANRVLDAISGDVFVDDLRLTVSGSLGVTVYPLDNSDADTLIRHADQAMYEAKVQGRNRFNIFDATQNVQAQERHESLARIKCALDNNEFELYYQPKVDLSSNQVMGFEALIRWNHPEDGVLTPNYFLPLMNGHKLLQELDDWVVRRAFEQLERWKEANKNYELSINITGESLLQEDFVPKMTLLLKLYQNVDAKNLELEVLETSTLEDVQMAREQLNAIRNLGMSVALDDFGTGYSSLSYLRNLPADCLKIDRSFVFDMLKDDGDKAIIEGVVQLANVFKLDVIAEGVETEEMAKELVKMGCERIQGFWLSRPMPENQIEDWVASWYQQCPLKS